MHQRALVFLAVTAASSIAALIGACSSGDSTNVDAGNDATTNDVIVADSPAADTGVMDAGTDSNPIVDSGGGPCTNSEAGCARCCQMLHPDAAALVRTDLVMCACTSMTAACKMQNQCGNSLCNNKAPSPGCTACLEDPDAGDCLHVANVACSGDPDCAELLACESTCGDGG